MRAIQKLFQIPKKIFSKPDKYTLSEQSLERLQGIKPVLIDILEEGIRQSPFEFRIPRDGGLRTPQRQKELYAYGRTTAQLLKKGIKGVEGIPDKSKKTWTLNSKHLPKNDGYGHAFDIYIQIEGNPSWDLKYIEPVARHLQKIALDKFGTTLYWGQDLWGKDGAHFQL